MDYQGKEPAEDRKDTTVNKQKEQGLKIFMSAVAWAAFIVLLSIMLATLFALAQLPEGV